MEKFIIIFIILLLGSLISIISTKDENKVNKEKATKNTMTINKMMYIVALSSFAIVIGFFEIPLTLIGAKLDLSEVVILISFLILGFKGSVLVIFLRSFIRFFITTVGTSVFEADPLFKLFGEGIAVVASLLILLSFILTNFILNKREKPLLYAVPTKQTHTSLKQFILAPTITAIILTLGMTVFHYFITIPVYGTYLNVPVFDKAGDLIIFLFAGFGLLNIIKGVISPLIFLLIKPKIENIIK